MQGMACEMDKETRNIWRRIDAYADVILVSFQDGGSHEWVEVKSKGPLVSVLEVVPSSLEK